MECGVPLAEGALLLPLLGLVSPWQPPGASSGESTQLVFIISSQELQPRDAAAAGGVNGSAEETPAR